MQKFLNSVVLAFLPCTKLMEGMNEMSAALDRLTAEVSEQRSATGSLIALVGGLADQIRALAGDEEALNALADDLDAQQGDIAAAVAANAPEAEGGSEEPLPVEEPAPDA